MPSIRQLISMVMLLVLLAAGAWLYMNDINPLDWENVKSEWRKTQSKVDDISHVIENPDAMDKTQTRVYRKKDANGNWYFTNEPLKEGEQGEELKYRSDTNVMPLPEELKKKEK